MKLNLAYPPAGTQKLVEIDDDSKLLVARPAPSAARAARCVLRCTAPRSRSVSAPFFSGLPPPSS